jgi:hypothetical protein
VYDPNEITRTTIKETNIHNERDGALDTGVRRRTVYDPNDITRTTLKETNIHNERDGALNSVVRRGTTYDPNDITKTTIKETNIHNERSGQVTTVKNATTIGVQDKLRVTHKQLLHRQDQARNMASGDVHKGKVYDPNDIAKTTIKETSLYEERKGNMDTGTYRGEGYLTNPKTAPDTSRQFVSTVEYTGDADGPEVGGYQVTEVDAPNTQKQFLSDKEYSGNANGDDKPMSYEDVYNATLNEEKEYIAEGRQPTNTSTKQSVGAENVNMDIKPKISEDEDGRDWTGSSHIAIATDVISRGVSTREKIGVQTEEDQIEPELLEAFRQNPYTQPLDSSTMQ